MSAKKVIEREGFILVVVVIVSLVDLYLSFSRWPIIIRTLIDCLPLFLWGGYGAYIIVRLILWAIETLRNK